MSKRNPDLFVFFLFLLLSLIFFGKVIFTNSMLYGTDWLSGSYMQRDFFERSLKDGGQFALWNPLQFAGIPTGEGFFGEIFYPLTFILKLLFPTYLVWTLIFVIHPIIAGFGTYLFLKKRVGSILTAVVFSAAYMFTSVIISEVYGGHDGRVIVMSYLPLLIYFLDIGFRNMSLKNFLLASIPASMMFLSGHIQSTYYSILFGVFYVSFIHIDFDYINKFRNYTFFFALIIGFIFSFIHTYFGFMFFLASIIAVPAILDKKFNKKSFAVYSYLAVFLLFTVIISGIQYIPVMRFMPEAARGVSRDYSYAVSWSMGFADIFDQIVSGFSGINLNGINTYWGENPFKLHSSYIGVIPLLLALGFMFSKNKKNGSNFFVVSSITALILALGGSTPLYKIFYGLFPYVNKFRAPELIFFIFSFSVIVMAALYFDRDDKNHKPLIYASIAFSFFAFAIIAFPGVLVSIFKSYAGSKINYMDSALKSAPLSALKTIAFALILIAGFTVLNKKYMKWFIISLGILIVFDLWMNNSKFVVPIEEPNKYFAKDKVVEYLEQDSDIYRVFSLGYRNDDYLTLFNKEIISGNHPSPFADYQKFMNNKESVMFNPEKLFMVPNRLRFLNVKYTVMPIIPLDTLGYDAKAKNLIMYYNSIINSMSLDRVAIAGDYMILKSRNFLPRAFCSDSFIITDKMENVLTIIDNDKNCGTEYIILDKSIAVEKDSAELSSSVNFFKATPNNVHLKVYASKECALVLLDQYYKTWKCTVNGKNTEIIRAFGIFRAVKIDRGDNDIVFYYDSKLQIVTALISLFGLLTVLGYAVWKRKSI